MRIFVSVWIILSVKAVWADGDPARGEKRFEECIACHTLEQSANSVGPSLRGVFERSAGQVPNFLYSPAMRRSKIRWTPKTLDEFIADPQKMVPANRMPYAGMPEASGRADLIAYLQKVFK